MTDVLITPTLLDSFDFAMYAPKSWKQRAMNDFIGKIKREKGTFPGWVQKGIDFEDEVYKVCDYVDRKHPGEKVEIGSPEFQQIANACLGGDFQRVFKRSLEVKTPAGDYVEVLFYNKCDVVLSEKIIDIKTTMNYRCAQKYLDKWQHKMYCWASGIDDFEYIVAEWKDEDSVEINAVHTIEYKSPDEKIVEADILNAVDRLFHYLQANQLWTEYYNIFSNNGRR